MEKRNGLWEDEEVKTLFKLVEIKKGEGVPLIKIFENYANATCRKKNSVRNYYYKEIKLLSKDRMRLNILNINLKSHITKRAIPFDNHSTKRVIEDVNKMVANGYSVRRACLTLAGGDVNKMMRYQNKYRSEIKYKKDMNMGNIIKMPINSNMMSDEDINALFLGIIKLVKKQEMEKAKNNLQIQIDLANDRLKKVLKDVVIKNAEIEKLRAQIDVLKCEVENKKEKEVMGRVKLLQNREAKDMISSFIDKKRQEKAILNV